jgi:hypothetical protein
MHPYWGGETSLSFFVPEISIWPRSWALDVATFYLLLPCKVAMCCLTLVTFVRTWKQMRIPSSIKELMFNGEDGGLLDDHIIFVCDNDCKI